MYICAYAYQITQRFIFYRLSIKHRDDTDLENVKLTARERRFIKFASVEYENQLYMTPQDFLESVVEQEPRREWKSYRILSKSS